MTRAVSGCIVAVLCLLQLVSSNLITDIQDDFTAISLGLIQTRAEAKVSSESSLEPEWGGAADQSQSCADLENHGSYFSVLLEAGTPPQSFEVVADTGSDAVIIPSCICRASGSCSGEDRCFHGTGNSTSFVMQQKNKQVPLMDMEFGSGTIKAAVTTDVVRVGGTEAVMKEGLLLMVDRQLDIVGSFEGILGLGQLQSEYTSGMAAEGDGASWDRPADSEDMDEEGSSHVTVPGFLRKAHIDRFSICFNDGESPGVLRLDTHKQANGVPSVGTLHWGMDMHGFSVGSSAASKVLFCGAQQDDEAGCGAIPDSGTTVMLGPDDQIRTLFQGICDEWPRCKQAHQKEFKGRTREDTFQLVLAQCEDWLSTGEGLDELPSIYLHLGSDEGKKKTLELSAWSYIFESLVDDLEPHSALLGSVGVSFASILDAKPKKDQYACAPAFGASDYSASGSGPVWIVGTPLFYEYIVGYDRSTSPPEVTFSGDPCGKCHNSKKDDAGIDNKMILTEESRVFGYQRFAKNSRRKPRKISRAPRVGHNWRSKTQKPM